MIHNILDVCVICSKKEELVDHLFLHCEVASSVCCHFICKCGLAWSVQVLFWRQRSLVGGGGVAFHG